MLALVKAFGHRGASRDSSAATSLLHLLCSASLRLVSSECPARLISRALPVQLPVQSGMLERVFEVLDDARLRGLIEYELETSSTHRT